MTDCPDLDVTYLDNMPWDVSEVNDPFWFDENEEEE